MIKTIQEVKDELKEMYPQYQGFIEHTLVSTMCHEYPLKQGQELPIDSVSESAVRDALAKILKVGASMVTTGISGDISEWDLPKTTPVKTQRKIVEEADKWNDVNRRRAIELKNAYDVLSKHFR